MQPGGAFWCWRRYPGADRRRGALRRHRPFRRTRSARLALVVFPALLVNYYGEGALLLSDPAAALAIPSSSWPGVGRLSPCRRRHGGDRDRLAGDDLGRLLDGPAGDAAGPEPARAHPHASLHRTGQITFRLSGRSSRACWQSPRLQFRPPRLPRPTASPRPGPRPSPPCWRRPCVYALEAAVGAGCTWTFIPAAGRRRALFSATCWKFAQAGLVPRPSCRPALRRLRGRGNRGCYARRDPRRRTVGAGLLVCCDHLL